ncbi:class I SAM-dependent methyltransferase [Hyphomonas sp.]|uniref:class I SAM-dependent methyltransferase n=1 Tax=Hyphomonas sp. TaxID=87 RepID=UPI00391A00C7
MSSDTITGDAIAGLAAALARALHVVETAPTAADVRIRLPHPFSNLTREDWANSIRLWRTHGAPLLEGLARRNCPTCGGVESDHIFNSYDGYPYHECVTCRTWFVPLDVKHDLFERYFEIVPEARRYGDYTDSQAVDPAAQSADQQRFTGYYSALKACLARPQGMPVSTLDIGCGVANSLATAEGLGFAAAGIEVNTHAVTLARKLGRQVHFPGELAGGVAFDSVTMWETLEHIADPLSALQEAHARLKPDGLLALTVPNLNAPDIRTMRGDSMQIHGGPAWPGHINLWTPETLSELLRKAGFEPVHLSGQFSTNLEELTGYLLGQWSGAREYLRGDAPEFMLPSALRDLVAATGPAFVAWQEGFSFAPILFVLARRRDGTAPAGLQSFTDSKAAARRSGLQTGYRLPEAAAKKPARGMPLDLSQSEWCAPEVALESHRLHLRAGVSPAFGYLWKSPPLDLPAGSSLRLRGVLYGGSFSAGLLQAEAWVDQIPVTGVGPFELVLTPPGGTAWLVLSNNDNGGGPADAVIDCAELVSPS